MSPGQCPACGSATAPAAAFCQNCGHRLGSTPPAPADTLRSERKIVTILFADITGSLTMIAGMDPERVDDVLAELIETMGRAVRRFGGIVCQTLGDGVMALFGAPRAMEDHAVQACLAALAMRTALHSETSARLAIRVGLNSGEVVVRGVRDDVTTRYGAVGEPVHVAARMEQSAEPDQILMTAETRRLAGGLIETRAFGPMRVKGLERAQELFELVRAAPRRAPRAAAPAGRLVGREAELATMQAARDRAAAGQGRAMRLIGDAGCGKSRLLREFLAELPPDEWLVCQAEALPHRQTSYGAVTAMLTDLLGFEPGDSLDHRRARMGSRLEELGAPAGRFAPPLASLLDLGVDDPGWHGMEPWERRERTGQAASELFLRASRGARCAALVIEDAHWVDDESADLFERLAAASAGERLLAIVTERAERNLSWTRSGSGTGAQGWTEFQLHPLDEAASRRLLREHLLPGPGVAGLEERLVAHTGGNPLFIEECLYALAEAGELTRTEDGRFRLGAPVTALRVPRSLRGLLDARVDRLADDDKDLLQAASVVGTSVPVDLLRSVLDRAEDGLHPALERLCQHGFLRDERGDGTRFVFRHGLTREAVYNGILLRTRSRMHADALRAMEGQPGSATDAADMLADHAFRAELWPKAVDYARAAGTRAAARDANGEALRAFEQALTAAARLPPGAGRDGMLLKLQIEARAPMFRLGDVAGLCAHVEEAIQLAVRQDDGRAGSYQRVGQCRLFGSHAMWLAGRNDAALAMAREAGALGAAWADRDLAMRAQFQEGLVQLSQGRVADAIAGMRDVLAHIAVAPAPAGYGLDEALAVTALGYLARAAADAGDFVTAEGSIADARQRAQRLDKRFSWIFVEIAEGSLLLTQGRAAQAVDPLHRAVATCRAADARLLGPIPGALLALALLETGDVAAALPMAQQAVTDAARMGFSTSQPMRLAILAQALHAAGQADAPARAEEALALARRQGESGAEAYVLCRLAPLLPDPRAAMESAREIANALGLRPLAARCAEALGEPKPEIPL